MQHDVLDWPDETEPLPPMTLKLFKAALFSFANGTGLGWDGVHPRALLRLPDEVLYLCIALMLKCKRSGVASSGRHRPLSSSSLDQTAAFAP